MSGTAPEIEYTPAASFPHDGAEPPEIITLRMNLARQVIPRIRTELSGTHLLLFHRHLLWVRCRAGVILSTPS
jgi:hypothetical protein